MIVSEEVASVLVNLGEALIALVACAVIYGFRRSPASPREEVRGDSTVEKPEKSRA